MLAHGGLHSSKTGEIQTHQRGGQQKIKTGAIPTLKKTVTKG